MKRIYLMLMVLTAAPYLVSAAEPVNYDGYEGGVPGKCYCSVKCGPRDIKPEDTPFYDEATQRYFCQQRDYDLYIPNKCYLPRRGMQKRVTARRAPSRTLRRTYQRPVYLRRYPRRIVAN